jgi:hypothetical protein
MHEKPEGVIGGLIDPDLLYALIILVSLGVMAVSACALFLLMIGVL